MSLLRAIARGVQALFRKERADRELDDELRRFVEMAVTEKDESGMTRAEAVRAVRLERGSIEGAKERVRAEGWESFVKTCWRDLRFAVRSLARTPGFTSVALLVIAAGIGVNTAVFSVVDAVLLKPLTYPDPQALVQLVTTSNQGPIPVARIPEYNIWQQQSNIFQQVAAYDWGGAGTNLAGGDHPEQVLGMHATSGYFALFGAHVVAGRTFTAAEDVPNGGHVAVLSYGLWNERFGANPEIVDSTIRLDEQPYLVVGVIGSPQ
jgi:putative ABC transport system permease protein